MELCDRTSHWLCQMKKPLHILGLSHDPKRRLFLEDEETPVQVLIQCPALITIRMERWGKSEINPLDVQATRDPRKLCGFVRATKLEEK